MDSQKNVLIAQKNVQQINPHLNLRSAEIPYRCTKFKYYRFLYLKLIIFTPTIDLASILLLLLFSFTSKGDAVAYIAVGIGVVLGSVVWIDFSPWYSFLGYIGLPLGVGLILKGRTRFILEILYKKYSWLLL